MEPIVFKNLSKALDTICGEGLKRIKEALRENGGFLDTQGYDETGNCSPCPNGIAADLELNYFEFNIKAIRLNEENNDIELFASLHELDEDYCHVSREEMDRRSDPREIEDDDIATGVWLSLFEDNFWVITVVQSLLENMDDILKHNQECLKNS